MADRRRAKGILLMLFILGGLSLGSPLRAGAPPRGTKFPIPTKILRERMRRMHRRKLQFLSSFRRIWWMIPAEALSSGLLDVWKDEELQVLSSVVPPAQGTGRLERRDVLHTATVSAEIVQSGEDACRAKVTYHIVNRGPSVLVLPPPPRSATCILLPGGDTPPWLEPIVVPPNRGVTKTVEYVLPIERGGHGNAVELPLLPCTGGRTRVELPYPARVEVEGAVPAGRRIERRKGGTTTVFEGTLGHVSSIRIEWRREGDKRLTRTLEALAPPKPWVETDVVIVLHVGREWADARFFVTWDVRRTPVERLSLSLPGNLEDPEVAGNRWIQKWRITEGRRLFVMCRRPMLGRFNMLIRGRLSYGKDGGFTLTSPRFDADVSRGLIIVTREGNLSIEVRREGPLSAAALDDIPSSFKTDTTRHAVSVLEFSKVPWRIGISTERITPLLFPHIMVNEERIWSCLSASGRMVGKLVLELTTRGHASLTLAPGKDESEFRLEECRVDGELVCAAPTEGGGWRIPLRTGGDQGMERRHTVEVVYSASSSAPVSWKRCTVGFPAVDAPINRLAGVLYLPEDFAPFDMEGTVECRRYPKSRCCSLRVKPPFSFPPWTNEKVCMEGMMLPPGHTLEISMLPIGSWPWFSSLYSFLHLALGAGLVALFLVRARRPSDRRLHYAFFALLSVASLLLYSDLKSYKHVSAFLGGAAGMLGWTLLAGVVLLSRRLSGYVGRVVRTADENAPGKEERA